MARVVRLVAGPNPPVASAGLSPGPEGGYLGGDQLLGALRRETEGDKMHD